MSKFEVQRRDDRRRAFHRARARLGFVDVRLEVVTSDRGTPQLPTRLNIMPMGLRARVALKRRQEQKLAAIESEVAPILAQLAVAGGFTVPISSNVLTVVVPA